MAEEEEEFVCSFRERCRTWSRACTFDVANASNCGFIAAVEAEKELGEAENEETH